ncbi:MAG: radical SAM protein [Desulfobacterales bacterium]|nr:radical SAM protein [Desulfobacterales bacterium]MBF0397300.1 radical SAM protein [Desulfobacterales bacterium]
MAEKEVLLLQLPIPRLNFGTQTGNIPLASAVLKVGASFLSDIKIEILKESASSYLSDLALIKIIANKKPQFIGFTVYSWNVERSIYFAQELKKIYPAKIIFGGPEITKDNPIIKSEYVDFYVYGEGENIFINILSDFERTLDIFKKAKSPYVLNLMEPEIEDMMLLEIQRGCKYQCAYCYYNKGYGNITFSLEDNLFEAIIWAIDKKISEVYLLTPSMELKPNLKSFIKKIAELNKSKTVSFNSEIRAEYIDEELADLFNEANFSFFEIGLQTINPKVLKSLKRGFNRIKFLKGAKLLKKNGIIPRIDLILGLPFDDLMSFKASVDFISENDLSDDVQVFPLLLLPGTDFRLKYKTLGINFNPNPPYPVIQTLSMSKEDIFEGIEYAEKVLNTSLYPMPELDISYIGDSNVDIYGKQYISKLLLKKYHKLSEIEDIGSMLTSPYQIFIWDEIFEYEYIMTMLSILTSLNPFTPFEIIFLEPNHVPDTKKLLSKILIKRPHFLDIDMRYMYGTSGNRSVLFTLVSQDKNLHFYKEMERQIYLWKHINLPEMEDLYALSHLHGILIDSNLSYENIKNWQDKFVKHAQDIIWINFSNNIYQKRWMELI